jgi:hypothetical protein
MARVDGGSVLLGAPGAPGCTIVGTGGVCCAATTELMKTVKMLAARNACTTLARGEPGFGVCSRRKVTCRRFWVRGKIFIRTRTKSCHETENSSTTVLGATPWIWHSLPG